ncbi:MAG: FMN-binding negative transcriptional regulator [Chloroflexota bacterium]
MLYLPAHFEQADEALMHRLLADFPLGLLVTLGGGGLSANHIPFVFEPGAGEQGRLIGHVARNNDVWRDHDPATEALVVFQSANAYISPNWYPSKAETHKAVPTWNYAVVHVYGPLIVRDDEKWVRGQAGKLVKIHEAAQPVPWKMADAPREYTEMMLSNIVGIEIPVTRMIGKWKANQNRDPADRESVAANLAATGSPENAAMAAVMAEVIGRP